MIERRRPPQVEPACEEVLVPMRDGVRLATDLYRPPDGDCGPWPALLTRTPYGRRYGSIVGRARAYARAGFLVAVQDVRGRGGSEGVFRPFLDEPADGYDAVAWLHAYAACEGSIGTFGQSYGAWTQLQLAIEQPPGLAAMVPMYGPLNGYRDSFRDGGVLQLWWLPWLAWLETTDAHRRPQQERFVQQPEPTEVDAALLERLWALGAAGEPAAAGYREQAQGLIAHATYDAFWRQPALAMDEQLARVPDIPILWVGGWYDFYPRAACEGFARLRRDGRRGQRLLVGPWDHGGCDPTCGDVHFGDAAAVSILELELAWFAHWLKGADAPPLDAPATVFVMGRESERDPWVRGAKVGARKLFFEGGAWAGFDAWPPAQAIELTLHLTPDGRLTEQPPDAGAPASRFRCDPQRPAPALAWSYVDYVSSGMESPWNVPPGPRNVADVMLDGVRLLERDDVLCFACAPLERDVEIVGSPRVTLVLSSSAPDPQVVVTLCKAYPASAEHPQGFVMPVAAAALRASHRGGSERPVPLSPGVPSALELELSPTAVLVPAAASIVLLVGGASLPRLAPPRDGADNAVHHDTSRPSRLRLPVARA